MPELVVPAVEPQKTKCDHCGQRIQLQRKEILNKACAIMLKRAAEHVMHTMKNDFEIRDFTEDGDFKFFSNFSHLRYHGLIANVKVNGKPHKRRYLITRNGWAWLRGDIELPKFRIVKNGHNVEGKQSDRLVYLRDIWHGEPYVQTTFEYFDDAGNPVGIRPHYPSDNTNQARLI